jgi:hypothetical protein
MYSRQSLLGLSIVVSVLAHLGLLAVAPMVTFQDLTPVPQKAPHRFHVRIRTEAPPPEAETRTEAGPPKGPGSVEELLRQEAEAFKAVDSLLDTPSEIPQLSDRLASELVDREHFLEPDPAILREVDSKIIEISQATARQDIEIARRLVSPSADRLVGENEYPTLRGPGDSGEEPMTVGSLPVRSLLGEDMPDREPAGAQAAAAPQFEADVNLPPRDTLAPPAAVKRRLAPVVADIAEEAPFEFMDDLLDVKVSAYFPPQEKTAYFRVEIAPKTDSNIPPLPKDVTFVIDASNSIVQHKLDQTARAARDMVKMLRPDDRFNIVVFRDSPSPFKPDFTSATPAAKAEAATFLTTLESKGGTNVYNAIRPVVQTAPRPGVPGVVIVMSDGRPTAGVKDARTIINGLTAENVLGNTIFACGGGNTVNQYLLDLLAYRNKGESHVAPSIEGIKSALPAFFARLNDPLLVELNADFGRIDKTEIFPKDIPDFYKNKAVTVYGQFDPAKDREFFMRLTGAALGDKKEVIFKTDLRQAATGDDQIARNWAFQKIYYLIGEICRVGEQPELLAELRDLSRKYNIRTSYD